MSADAAKRAHERLLVDVVEERRVDGLPALFADEHVFHQTLVPNLPPGVSGARALAGALLRSFGPGHVVLEQQIATADRCMTYATALCRHDGATGPIPATGRRVILSVMLLSRFDAQGRMAETWAYPNALEFARVIGAAHIPDAFKVER